MNIAGRLEAAWLAQLTREYNDICYQYGVRLQPPVLTLSDSRRRLGQWSPADRGLSLSRHLRGMGDDNDRMSLRFQLVKDPHDLFAGAAVQRTGRLIRKYDRRLCRKCPCNSNTLLLSAGELAW